MELDMNREPVSALLTGINLWTVKSAKIEKSQKSGTPMLVLEFKCGEYELKDRAMLAGGGWGIGKAKLIALGMSPTFTGNFDPLDLIGRKVWIATVEGTFAGVDKKSGAPKNFKKLEVDIGQLKHAGYNLPEEIPAGAAEPAAGLGPVDEDFAF